MNLTTEGPHWRYCCTGMNVEGICTNSACEAHDQMIIDMKVGPVLLLLHVAAPAVILAKSSQNSNSMAHPSATCKAARTIPYADTHSLLLHDLIVLVQAAS